MNKKSTLIIGDIVIIAIVTVIGFVTHDEFALQFLPRMAAMFFPLVAAWLVLALWVGLFEAQTGFKRQLLWQIPLAVIFAVPLAFIVRGLILSGMPVVPIVAVVFIAITAIALIIWRYVHFLFLKK